MHLPRFVNWLFNSRTKCYGKSNLIFNLSFIVLSTSWSNQSRGVFPMDGDLSSNHWPASAWFVSRRRRRSPWVALLEDPKMGTAYTSSNVWTLWQPRQCGKQGLPIVCRMVSTHFHRWCFESVAQCIGPISQQSLHIAPSSYRNLELP